jgi:hypothetical protein
MKKIFLILTLLPISLWSQSNNTYKEFNFGIAVVDDFGFPGASFLFGQTNYYTNHTLLDYQIGIAFPSILTGKVGLGIGDTDFATIIGIRAWPTCPYFQFSLKERHNFSIEYHIFKEFEFFQGTNLIFTYGIRF